ncbi:MAG TPA: hypothetical protein VFZ49_06345 [Pyrinomonadaceae bacterium]
MLRFLSSVLVLFVCAVGVLGQDAEPTPTPLPTATPLTAPKSVKEIMANPTAESVAETALFVYALAGGRPVMEQIRKTTIERGKTKVMNGDGRMETANYQKWIIRGTSLDKEKLRIDHEFPTVNYSLILNEDKTFGIHKGTQFTPTDSASKAFQNQIYRGLDGLLRYKENGSTLSLAGKEKVMGVEYHLIDVTDKAGRKTRYFVSAKTFRIMMLEYEDEARKYKRKFYDYNYAQGTLVPYRTVLYEGDKIVEETDVGTVTFGQRVDESLFPGEAVL